MKALTVRPSDVYPTLSDHGIRSVARVVVYDPISLPRTCEARTTCASAAIAATRLEVRAGDSWSRIRRRAVCIDHLDGLCAGLGDRLLTEETV